MPGASAAAMVELGYDLFSRSEKHGNRVFLFSVTYQHVMRVRKVVCCVVTKCYARCHHLMIMIRGTFIINRLVVIHHVAETCGHGYAVSINVSGFLRSLGSSEGTGRLSGKLLLVDCQ